VKLGIIPTGMSPNAASNNITLVIDHFTCLTTRENSYITNVKENQALIESSPCWAIFRQFPEKPRSLSLRCGYFICQSEDFFTKGQFEYGGKKKGGTATNFEVSVYTGLMGAVEN
jgi:hypothetical protein